VTPETVIFSPARKPCVVVVEKVTSPPERDAPAIVLESKELVRYLMSGVMKPAGVPEYINVLADLALESEAEKLRAFGVSPELVLRTGEPIREILHQTTSTQYDLTIVGAEPKGNSGLYWRAEKSYEVIKAIPSPVLIATGACETLKSFVVCTGGKNFIDAAVQLTGKVAAAVGASVTLLHVMAEPPAIYADLVRLDSDTAAAPCVNLLVVTTGLSAFTSGGAVVDSSSVASAPILIALSIDIPAAVGSATTSRVSIGDIPASSNARSKAIVTSRALCGLSAGFFASIRLMRRSIASGVSGRNALIKVGVVVSCR